MEELTRERAHDLCVEMWNEIAENGYNDKKESYLAKKYKPKYLCFACEFYKEEGVGDCNGFSSCPFSIFGNCDCDGSPYEDWFETGETESAIAIADLFID